MILLRALARLVTFVVLVALAVAGLTAAVFSLGSSGSFSLPGLAQLVRLPALRDEVGRLLGAVEASGPLAGFTALCGLGSALLGLLLLVGALRSRRERLAVLERTDEGMLAARRRPLGRVAAALVEQVRGVTATTVKLRPGRRGGGRLAVEAVHSRTTDPEQVRAGGQEMLASLTEAFGLKARIRPRVGGPRQRVQ